MKQQQQHCRSEHGHWTTSAEEVVTGGTSAGDVTSSVSATTWVIKLIWPEVSVPPTFLDVGSIFHVQNVKVNLVLSCSKSLLTGYSLSSLDRCVSFNWSGFFDLLWKLSMDIRDLQSASFDFNISQFSLYFIPAPPFSLAPQGCLAIGSASSLAATPGERSRD